MRISVNQAYEQQVKQLQDMPESVEYEQLWRAYLDSHYASYLLTDTQNYHQKLTQLQQGQLTCQQLDWPKFQQRLFFALGPHLAAKDCFLALGRSAEAAKYQQHLDYVLAGILAHGDGKTPRTAYPMMFPQDAQTFVKLQNWQVKEQYMTLGDNGLGLYEVYVIERDDGYLEPIYFDYGRYLHIEMGLEYPFSWANWQMYNQIIIPKAEHDGRYVLAAAQVMAKRKKFDKAQAYYLQAISQGSVVAYYQLGLLCLKESLGSVNKSQCPEYLFAAANQGYGVANVAIAYRYTELYGLDSMDDGLALQQMQVAQRKMPQGQAWLELVQTFASQFDVPSKVKFYQRAIAQGAVNAKSGLLYVQLNQFNRTQISLVDVKPLLNDVLAQISQMDATNIGLLATMIFPQQSQLALSDEQLTGFYQALKTAARQGSAEANFIAAWRLSTIKTGNQAEQQQINDYFFKAAEKFNVEAQIQMGNLYQSGQLKGGIPLASQWYGLCALQNSHCLLRIAALTILGYQQGLDIEFAIALVSEHANKGEILAEGIMAMAYEKGTGVEKSLPLALQWYAKTANKGDKVGQYHLCRLGLAGFIAQQYNANPKAWCEKAAAQGHPLAVKLLQEI